MQYSVFVVDDIPYCVWEWDLQERNLRFVESIDHEYFEYLATTYATQLDGPHAQRAATALRTAYHHGLETFFTLVCATLQAPLCIVGWMQKCQTHQLRNLVRKIHEGHHKIRNKLCLQEVTWDAVSDAINLFSYEDEARTQETKELFAVLWSRLAHDYLDDYNIKEYNSIKHGFRARAGGFTLFAGLEHKYGVQPPAEEMKVVGGSEFGTSFYLAERVQNAPKLQRDPHFRVRLCSLNWRPEAMIQALQLISISIGNLISYLRILHGVDPKTVPFRRPQDSEFFHAPWQNSVSVTSASFDTIVAEQHIHRFSNDEILAQLEQMEAGNAP